MKAEELEQETKEEEEVNCKEKKPGGKVDEAINKCTKGSRWRRGEQ